MISMNIDPNESISFKLDWKLFLKHFKSNKKFFDVEFLQGYINNENFSNM